MKIYPDPLIHFNLWLKEAHEADLPEPEAMVLSTTDLSGHVTARVVLLKGSDHRGFQFFTNYHSRKGLQLAENPKAALTFLWRPMERQIRVEGKVKQLSRKESVAYFNTRPIESRINASISPQSAVIPDRAFLTGMREGFILDLQGEPPVCPENWGGYVLRPETVEFWQSDPFRLHDRLRYRRKGKLWITEILAP